MKKLKTVLFILLGVTVKAHALGPVGYSNAYMVENTSGTSSSSGQVCYDFQTRPNCYSYIAGLSTASIPSGSTQYIQNTATPSTATQQFSVLSGTITTANVSTMNVTTALLLNNAAGNAGDVLTSNGAGIAPTYQPAGSTLLNSTNTWTAPQTFSSATIQALGPAVSPTLGTVTSADTLSNMISKIINQRVVQVVTSSLTTSSSTVLTNFVPSALTVAITPQSATNKVYVTASGNMNGSVQNKFCQATIQRGNANLTGSSAAMCQLYSQTGGTTVMPCTMGVLDSPLTASATSYTVYFKADSGTACDWGNLAFSQITAIELGQ